MNVLAYLQTIADAGSGAYGRGEDDAWMSGTCGYCGGTQFLVVAQQVGGQHHKPAPHLTKWLRCTSCRRGSVWEGNRMLPSRKPLRSPSGLPQSDQLVWEEVRTCLGAGAYAASVMLCRKLLLHVAVAHGLPPKNDRDRSPTYFAAVEHLQSEGLITQRMRPWVDRIKDVGNDANHELTPVSAELAMDVATFTEQLLLLTYELDALMGQTSP